MLRLIVLTMCLFVLALASTEDYEESGLEDDDLDEDFTGGHNSSGNGEYVGAPCEDTCNPKLIHVICDLVTRHCECERKYPVVLGQYKGCAKPVRLGDQCFYYKTCSFSDQNAECVQIKHNAICQCKRGYHTVTLQRPNKKVFCSQDLLVVSTDMPTLLGVATGLAIFTALICFVLKLFVGARPRHYANANLAPPILFASDTGIPLTVHNIRSASRASSERSGVATYSQRGSRGVLVPASRAGAARAAAILLISCHLTPEQTQQGSRVLSLASVHSSTSSSRSYSAKRYEREKEQRLLAARQREAITPSPRSTEQLLSEQQESDGSWVSKENSRTNNNNSSEQRTENEAGSSTSLPGVSSSLPPYEGSIMGPCTSEEWPQLR